MMNVAASAASKLEPFVLVWLSGQEFWQTALVIGDKGGLLVIDQDRISTKGRCLWCAESITLWALEPAPY
jgi:hypothetical protein